MKIPSVRIVALLTIGSLAACAREATAPATPQPVADRVAGDASGGGWFGFRGFALWGLRRAPDSLKLTDTQRGQIKTLVQQFRDAHQSELQTLDSVRHQAMQARRNGESRDQIKQVMTQAAPVRQQLRSASGQLAQQIRSVLTPSQTAWLASHQPAKCNATATPALSDEQRAQMKALFTSFQQTNKADLDAVRSAMQQARSARQAGTAKGDMKQLFESVKPAMERLKTARAQLHQQMQALLTPEQKASGCAPFMFGRGLRHQRAAG
jgi:Spy/CpxP family protein refolding chaperone